MSQGIIRRGNGGRIPGTLFGSFPQNSRLCPKGFRPGALWLDKIHFAPPKELCNDASPASANQQWFRMDSNWCRIRPSTAPRILRTPPHSHFLDIDQFIWPKPLDFQEKKGTLLLAVDFKGKPLPWKLKEEPMEVWDGFPVKSFRMPRVEPAQHPD